MQKKKKQSSEIYEFTWNSLEDLFLANPAFLR